MEIKCPGCQQFIDAESKFCPSCGRPMTAGSNQTKQGRVSCPDGNCVGVISDTGSCGKCGKDKNWTNPRKEGARISQTINQDMRICPNCGNIGCGKKVSKGSGCILLILFCCFIVPAIIYLIWDHKSKHEVCRSCGFTPLVPLNSPRGRELEQRFEK